MKKLLYCIIMLVVLLIMSDRIVKFYEDFEKKQTLDKGRSGTTLTAKQMSEYAEAGKFILMPYTTFGLKAGYHSDTININSTGLRGPEIGDKKSDSYRIAVIGGSAVFGGEVMNDNLTFCKLLEEDLKKSTGNKVEVINAGMPAYVSMQELILLEDNIIGLKPDLVIIFDGFNDVLTSLKRDKRPNYPWWFSEIERVYYTSITKLFMEKRLKKFRPTKRLLLWLESKKAKAAEDFTVSKEQIAFYKRNLDLMCHLSRSYGIDVLMVFQPVILYKNPLAGSEKSIISDLDPKYVKSLREMCEMAREAMMQTGKNNNVSVIDGADLFNGVGEDIFIDEVHFNQKGHNIVADALSDKVRSKIDVMAHR